MYILYIYYIYIYIYIIYTQYILLKYYYEMDWIYPAIVLYIVYIICCNTHH